MTRLRLAAAALLAVAAGARGEEATLTGSNTFRMEGSDAWGDPANAVGRHAPWRGYEALDVSAAWRMSRYDQWSVAIATQLSDQPATRGATLSTFTVRRENGETRIPYRVEAGDFNATVSTATSTRTDLKGLYGEIQPRSDALGILHSIAAFAGKSEDPWRDASRGKDESAGLSWIAETREPASRSAGMHWVRTVLAAEADAGRPRRSQDVASLTATAPFETGRAAWRWQAEIAALRGDNAPPPGEPARRERDTAIYTLLTGEIAASNVSWTLRGERSGPQFQAIAGSVQADRREAEGTFTWTGENAREVGLDWRRTRESLSSAAPADSRSFSVHVVHPLPQAALTLDVTASEDASRRADGSEDRVRRFFNPFVERSWGDASVKLELALQREEDRAAQSVERKRDIVLSGARNFEAFGWKAHVGPALRWSASRKGDGADREFEAGGTLTLARGRHRLSATVNGIERRPASPGSPDVTTAGSNLTYRYARGPHTITVGYRGRDRYPSPGSNSHGYTATLEWSVKLDSRPAAPAARDARAAFVPGARELPERLPQSAALIPAVPLGAEREALRALMDKAGFGEGARVLDTWVYPRQLLPDVRGRQKLALVFGARGLEKSALLIATDGLASPAEVGRAYDRALREMIERLGRPDRLRVQGAFTANFAGDLAAGRLVRYAEWDLAEGEGMVRVGIPRRLDGVVRIEIQRALALASPLEPGWALETIP